MEKQYQLRLSTLEIEKIDMFIRDCNKENIKSVHITQNPSAPYEKLDFLTQCPSLEKIWFSNSPIKDLSGLYDLSNLTHLGLPYGKLDLSNLRHLKVLTGYWDRKITGLSYCTSLKEIHLEKYNPKSQDFSEIEGLDNLEEIYITYSNVSSLNGLKNLKKLKKMTLVYFRNLESIKDLPVNLVELEMEGCKKIKDHDSISNLKKIESIKMHKCGDIPSLEFVKNMPSLKFFSFVETNVLDGNMSQLLESNLEYAGFLQKRHYSHNSSEINEALKKKNGDSWSRINLSYLYEEIKPPVIERIKGVHY